MIIDLKINLMRFLALIFISGLFLMNFAEGTNETCHTNTSFILLNASNNFIDIIEPNVTIFRNTQKGTGGGTGGGGGGNSSGEKGPIQSTNIEFSCGDCSNATFNKSFTRIGGGDSGAVCGFMSAGPLSIIQNDLKICAKNVMNGKKYTIELLTFVHPNRGCTDNNDGACNASGNATSYLRNNFTANCTNTSNLNQTNSTNTSSNQEAVANAKANLTFEKIKLNNINESNITGNLNLITKGIENTTIIWSSTNTQAINVMGVVSRNETDQVVNITAIISKGNISDNKTFNLIVKKLVKNIEDPALTSAKLNLTEKLILNGNPSKNSVIASLYLPTSLFGHIHVDIKWNTSNSSVIKIVEANSEFIVLKPANNFTDMIEPNVSIYRTTSQGGKGKGGGGNGSGKGNGSGGEKNETGPIRTTNLEFSCGTCNTATFENSVTQIGGGSAGQICGFNSSVPVSIIENEYKVCARNVLSGQKQTVKLLTFLDSKRGCIDNNDGSCNVSKNRTSYIRSNYGDARGDVIRSLINNTNVELTATLTKGNSSTTKRFSLNVITTPSPAFESEILVTNDTNEIILNNNSKNVTAIIIPKKIPFNKTIILNMENLLNTVTGNITYQEKDLSFIRETKVTNHSMEIFSNTTIAGGRKWNSLIIMPSVKEPASFISPSGNVDLVIQIGGAELNFSKPVKISLGEMTGKKAAFTSSDSTNLIEINTTCIGANNHSNIVNKSECYFDDGINLIIWSYHISIFGAFTPEEEPSETTAVSSGSGGGGGAGRLFRYKETKEVVEEETKEVTEKIEEEEEKESQILPNEEENPKVETHQIVEKETKPITREPEAVPEITGAVVGSSHTTSILVSLIIISLIVTTLLYLYIRYKK